MDLSGFVTALSTINFENTFNPYANQCPIYDLEDAPRRRSDTLLAILEVATKSEIDSIWIGRDLGYRGGRRTGLALTDDVQFSAHTQRWGLPVERPTRGAAIAERTATIIWQTLSQVEASIFLWNVFPLHPHEPGDPFSNRLHNAKEKEVGEEILSQLIILLKPSRLIAIGNDAAQTVFRLSNTQEIFRVRHPSHGGQSQFIKQIQDLYWV